MTESEGNSAAVAIGDFPVGASARSILLLGGSFDPPHFGHFRLPLLAREAIGADWLIYIPAARSPFKPDGPIAGAEDRIAMLRAGLESLRAQRVGIATLELDRADAAPSYTIDTLRAIRGKLGPMPALRLLIGADQAREFHRWREAKAIIKIAPPVVMLRAGDSAARSQLLIAMAPHWDGEELAAWESRIVDIPQIDASSTDIRRIVAQSGPDDPRLAALTPGSVIEEIRRRGLYRA